MAVYIIVVITHTPRCARAAADNVTQFDDNYNYACRCVISVVQARVFVCVCVWCLCMSVFDGATFMLRIKR